MVILILLALVGVAALFCCGYWWISEKHPTIGDKIKEGTSKVFSKFRKNK